MEVTEKDGLLAKNEIFASRMRFWLETVPEFLGLPQTNLSELPVFPSTPVMTRGQFNTLHTDGTRETNIAIDELTTSILVTEKITESTNTALLVKRDMSILLIIFGFIVVVRAL